MKKITMLFTTSQEGKQRKRKDKRMDQRMLLEINIETMKYQRKKKNKMRRK